MQFDFLLQALRRHLRLLTQSGQSWPSRWSPDEWNIQSQSSVKNYAVVKILHRSIILLNQMVVFRGNIGILNNIIVSSGFGLNNIIYINYTQLFSG